jgi:hypothetical protein
MRNIIITSREGLFGKKKTSGEGEKIREGTTRVI